MSWSKQSSCRWLPGNRPGGSKLPGGSPPSRVTVCAGWHVRFTAVIRPDRTVASVVKTSTPRVSDHGQRRADGSLDLHHFLLLHLAHVFHLLDLIVGELLDLVEGPLPFVFGDLLVLHRLLDGVIAIAANVSHGGPMILEDLV